MPTKPLAPTPAAISGQAVGHRRLDEWRNDAGLAVAPCRQQVPGDEALADGDFIELALAQVLLEGAVGHRCDRVRLCPQITQDQDREQCEHHPRA
jgi:hypothetical protein